MTKFGGPLTVAALLSFNGGFVDTAGFLGLQGLFLSHVTGNFVTLGAALVFGHHGIVGKLLALPEFIAVIALARFAGTAMRARQWPVLRVFLVTMAALLFVFFVLAVTFGPFADADTPLALLTALAGIAAMALQNAVQRVHLGSLPPTTIMTGSTTQATIDAVDLLVGGDPLQIAAARTRFGQLSLAIACFGSGCAAAAFAYWAAGFWCLVVPVVVGAVAATMHIEGAK